jgi:hypothetical protein
MDTTTWLWATHSDVERQGEQGCGFLHCLCLTALSETQKYNSVNFREEKDGIELTIASFVL